MNPLPDEQTEYPAGQCNRHREKEPCEARILEPVKETVETSAGEGVVYDEIQEIGDWHRVRIDNQVFSLAELFFDKGRLFRLKQRIKEVFGKVCRFYPDFSVAVHERFYVKGNDAILIACKIEVGLSRRYQDVGERFVQGAVERTRVASNVFSDVGHGGTDGRRHNTVRLQNALYLPEKFFRIKTVQKCRRGVGDVYQDDIVSPVFRNVFYIVTGHPGKRFLPVCRPGIAYLGGQIIAAQLQKGVGPVPRNQAHQSDTGASFGEDAAQSISNQQRLFWRWVLRHNEMGNLRIFVLVGKGDGVLAVEVDVVLTGLFADVDMLIFGARRRSQLNVGA